MALRDLTPGSTASLARAGGRRPRRWAAVAATGCLLTFVTACGSDSETAEGAFPCDKITWLIGQPPGGGSDQDVRKMQPGLEEALGAKLDIQYREGADGTLAWSDLTKAEADGCTLGTSLFPQQIVQPQMFESAGYETFGFTHVSLTERAPGSFFVRADSPYETLDDLIADATARPGEITVSSVGTVAGGSFAFVQFLEEAGVDMKYVPQTDGAGSAISAVQGGHIDVGALDIGAVLRSGDELRALAVSSDERHPALPDVPTFSELGFDVSSTITWGVIGPPGMPEDVTTQLSDAIQAVFADPEMEELILSQGLLSVASDPDEALNLVEDQAAIFEPLIPAAQNLG